MNCGAQAKAKKLGRHARLPGPATSSTPRCRRRSSTRVAAKKPDAMLIAPTDTKAMYAPIKQLADAGTKIVLVDTTLEQADLAVSQIASDNEGGGKAAAKALAEADRRQGQGVRRQRQARHLDHRPRARGLRGRGQGGSGSTTSGSEYNQDKPDKAAAITKARCQEPRPEGHLRDEPVLGRGRRDRPARGGQAKGVKIVGFDAGPKQVKDLKDGLCRRSIAQKPADIGAAGRRSRPSPRSKGEPTKKKIGTGSTIHHQGQPVRQPGRALQAVLLRRDRGAPPGAPRVAYCP